MIYPLIVLIAAVLIVVLLFIFVVPRFQDIYQELLAGDSLPLPTHLVIEACEYLQHQGWLLVTLIVPGVNF